MRKSASGSWVCARVGFLPGTDVNIKKILTSNTNTIPASVSTAEHGGTDASSTATATATTSSGKAMLVERNKEERKREDWGGDWVCVVLGELESGGVCPPPERCVEMTRAPT